MSVAAGAGNDTVTLLHECEITPGMSLQGGSGTDTLVSPVPLSTLQANGISVGGFEQVVVNTQQGHLSECF